MGNKRAIVLLSGGQDSVTTLAYAAKHAVGYELYAITFEYGQRHKAEIDFAKGAAKYFEAKHKIIKCPVFPGNSLTEWDAEIKADGGIDNLPTTFVPGRNLVFLSLASSFACSLGADRIYAGLCMTDYSGYPDCRQEFVDKFTTTAKYAMPLPDKFTVYTPLMYSTKAQTFSLAAQLGVLPFILKNTLSCYKGTMHSHEWGWGCGECPACQLRKKGYESFRSNFHA